MVTSQSPPSNFIGKVRTVASMALLAGFPLFMGTLFISEEPDRQRALLQFLCGIPMAPLAWLVLSKMPTGEDWWKRVSGSAVVLGPIVLLLAFAPMAAFGYFFGLGILGSVYTWRLRSRSGHQPLVLSDDEAKSAFLAVALRYSVHLLLAAIASIFFGGWYLFFAVAGFFTYVHFSLSLTLLRQAGRLSRATYVVARLVMLALLIVAAFLLADQM